MSGVHLMSGMNPMSGMNTTSGCQADTLTFSPWDIPQELRGGYPPSLRLLLRGGVPPLSAKSHCDCCCGGGFPPSDLQNRHCCGAGGVPPLEAIPAAAAAKSHQL